MGKEGDRMRQRAVVQTIVVMVMICNPVAAWAADSAQPDQPPVAQPAFSSEGLSPAARLTYASILFYRARRLMGSNDQEKTLEAFLRVQSELNRVLKDVAQEPDPKTRALVSSQSAFMLGDLFTYVFRDAAKAKASYQDAVKFFPEHDGATEALNRLP